MDLELNNKEGLDDERPLFEKNNAYLATATSDIDLTEDEDDDLGSSSFADHQYSNYNIPSHLKSILSYGSTSKLDSTTLDDDSDSDAEITSLTETAVARAGIDLDKLNAEIDRNKFANFPLKPPTAAAEEEEDDVDGNKKAKKAKKPREKKKRRDKGKQKAVTDIYEVDEQTRKRNFNKLLERFAQESESSEDEKAQKKSKKSQKSGRKTRKKVFNEIRLDENGEQMVRTTEILDATSSSSSEDERKLSKKQEMEMYRESERQRRSAKVLLKPVFNYKSFDDLAKRREEREQGIQHQDIVITHKAPHLYTPPRSLSNSRPTFNLELNDIDDDSDSDIEITGDPKKIAAATQKAMLSPERPRVPVAISPVRHASTALRNHNRSMLHRITNEGYDYRIKMEQAAKARGQYASATERARRLIEKEKNAMMINDQINRHFDKKKFGANNDDDDDEEDGDYEDGEEEDDESNENPVDDILNDLSGSEDEDEFFVQDAEEKPNNAHKRKNASDNEVIDNEDDEDDMAAMAFKRWKGKKVKKSTIFDDDDEDEQVPIKKKSIAKPVPAHSISNFFKAKETKANEEAAEQDENKTLSRLVRRKEREPSIEQHNIDENAMEVDAMDIDKPASAPVVVKKTAPSVPKGPREKLEYLEEEAVEEDDEFFGAGGSDGETGENLDEFEKDDLLVEDNNEKIDEAALREAFNLQDKETDSNMIQRLITDITSGNLRKQKAAVESGLMLDDIDLYDEEDNDLVAIRRAAAARRRRLLKKKGGDILENLLSDPKTAAFAKAAQAISEEAIISVFSESEGEAEEDEQEEKKEQDDDDEDYEKSTPKVFTKRVIVEEDDEEDDEDEDQEMKDVSDDENLLIVDEFDTMASPMRGLVGAASVGGGLASSIHITSADDEDVGFQIENMKSPINVRKSKPLYGSPGTLERFKRLIAETNNALNGTSSDTGGPRVGFGSVQQKQQQNNTESEEKPKLTGSLGEIFTKPHAKESKLKKLKSQSSSLFKYAE